MKTKAITARGKRKARGVYGCGVGDPEHPKGTYVAEYERWASDKHWCIRVHDGRGSFETVAHVSERWMAEAVLRAATRAERGEG